MSEGGAEDDEVSLENSSTGFICLKQSQKGVLKADMYG